MDLTCVWTIVERKLKYVILSMWTLSIDASTCQIAEADASFVAIGSSSEGCRVNRDCPSNHICQFRGREARGTRVRDDIQTCSRNNDCPDPDTQRCNDAGIVWFVTGWFLVLEIRAQKTVIVVLIVSVVIMATVNVVTWSLQWSSIKWLNDNDRKGRLVLAV